jgi:hypothetical protein
MIGDLMVQDLPASLGCMGKIMEIVIVLCWASVLVMLACMHHSC